MKAGFVFTCVHDGYMPREHVFMTFAEAEEEARRCLEWEEEEELEEDDYSYGNAFNICPAIGDETSYDIFIHSPIAQVTLAETIYYKAGKEVIKECY